MKPNPSTPPGLTLVVQVAFAGKRVLLTPEQAAVVDRVRFHAALELQLTERLRRVPADLGLTSRHRVCALSSLAIGGDLLFTRSCRTLGWWQRILLPQARKDFLKAEGERGRDFSDAEAAEAEELLRSPHIIEERVASVSADRHARFEDVNLELVRICDVFICLLPAEAKAGQPGGTFDALELAKRWRRPVLELRVRVTDDGQPELTGGWHGNVSPAGPTESGPVYAPPGLPAPLDQIDCGECDLTDPVAYRKALKDFASRAAARHQNRFKWAALFIVGAHVLATALALLAIKTHGVTALRWLLGVELSFLIAGLGYHKWLHRAHATRAWAMARLSAEVARSAIPLAGVRMPLRHLFELPMPDELRPLLRTLSVLHLKGIRLLEGPAWEERRRIYIDERLKKPKHGQIDYYVGKLAGARRWLVVAQGAFYVGSAGALIATAGKLSLTYAWLAVSPAAHDAAASVLGFLAVLLPVLAVAALSLAAAFDLEARVHTYEEMETFLEEQTRLLAAAATENEFAMLALRTEARLLGETANWHARRAFTGVA